ncbi:MAG: hypothetical protein GY704_09865, partial [Phycisphaeraceae bacterium]|nr:hypothetical protein [Phycisphaeraceae bacterium]
MIVFDIGLGEPRPEMMLCEAVDAPIPIRTRHAHKWSVGSVAVVGGSHGITGAAMLSARAALSAGAGAATVICPGMLQPIYAAMDPGVMSRGVGAGSCFTVADIDGILEAAARYDVLAIGPGLGPVDGGFVESLVARWEGPVVLDADGLNALSDPGALTRDGDIVVTPHAGEFSRLTGNEPNPATAGDLARDCGI